jgi:dCMP deaminase
MVTRRKDSFWLDQARFIAQRRSKDPSTKVGCVVIGPEDDEEVRAMGWNGFPRKVADLEERLLDRKVKHLIVVHAEANAVANSSRTGTSLKGCTAYVTHPCCSQCAALLAQAGIVRVVVPASVALRDDWKESAHWAETIFREAGVAYERFAEDEG